MIWPSNITMNIHIYIDPVHLSEQDPTYHQPYEWAY